MATISNTPRPGYVWDSTDNVWYPIGVGAHQHTNAADTPAVIPNALVDAKGDLLTATADNTPARLAVGSNNQVLTADSSTATGLKWATPTAPSFVGCRVTKTSAQSASNITLTTVSWDAETFDTDGFHDNVTNNSRITIPAGKAGKYLVTGTLTWNNNATGYREVRLTKNGTAYSIMNYAATATGDGGSYISTIINLAVGDYIDLRAEQSSGGSLDIKVNFSSFECQFLGA